jgi:hypothetical protein
MDLKWRIFMAIPTNPHTLNMIDSERGLA